MVDLSVQSKNKIPYKYIFFKFGPIPLPVHSPDFNPLDFYQWDHLKQLVFCTDKSQKDFEVR